MVRLVVTGRFRCRCNNEITVVKAAKLAHHRRKSGLAERIEALREWRFAQPPDDGGPDSPAQDGVSTPPHWVAIQNVSATVDEEYSF